MNESIVLWGLSGSGKTTVGKMLARRLRLPLLDTDSIIEQEAGKAISEIFRDDGEEYFRDLESEAVERAMRQSPAIVSVGGGAILRPGNRAVLALGRTVWLRAHLETLTARLYNSSRQALSHGGAAGRPLLAGNVTARLAELSDQRAQWYQRAEVSIDTDGRTPTEIAASILHALSPATEREVQHLVVRAGQGHYTVMTGHGALGHLPAALTELGLPRRLWIVSDSNVMPAYGRRVCAALQEAGFEPHGYAILHGEPSKTLRVAEDLWNWLAAQGAERVEAVVALGGGVVGDLAGFVASTYLRGVPFIQVPTTLLAQVDSSIGGKTAIDHPTAKNMIGTFYPARAVVVDTSLLQGLPPEQVSNGWAEVLKHGVILDAELFDFMIDHGDALSNLAPGPTLFAIRRSLAIKAGVVEQDERESRWRMILNFGHTIGQAIEAATHYTRYFHGHAVALGMLAAGWIALDLGQWSAGDFDRLRLGVTRLHLPSSAPGIDVPSVLEAALRDKKVRGKRIQWVLPTRIGEVVITDAVPDGVVERAVMLLEEGAFTSTLE